MLILLLLFGNSAGATGLARTLRTPQGQPRLKP